jgi:hypothetical protein
MAENVLEDLLTPEELCCLLKVKKQKVYESCPLIGKVCSNIGCIRSEPNKY